MGDFYYWAPAPKLGLPSCDINSLHALTYIKLAMADVNLYPMQQSFRGEGKVLGRLHTTEGRDIMNSKDIVKHLKRQGFDLDFGIAEDLASDIAPLTALIEEKLLPAVLYTLWMDAPNYHSVTHQVYAKSCHIPLNFVVPVRMQKQQEELVRVLKFWNKGDDEKLDEKTVDAALMTPACSVLSLLSQFLGEKEFLLGEKPSTLDALLFSVLAPIMKLQRLNNNKIRNELKKSNNLSQYVSRILRNNFKTELEQQSLSTGVEEADDTSTPSDPESVDWKYDVVLPVSVATVVMVSYAINVFVIARN